MPGNNSSGHRPRSVSSAPISSQWQHATVLVVDDHRMYRLLLGAMLEKLGVTHEACANGELALDAMARRPVDLVISDCRMPVMDGYALTREIRRRALLANQFAIPVIALSASLSTDDVRACKACGMDSWLIKPLSLAQLRKVLQYWLSAAQVRSGVDVPACVPVRWRHHIPTRANLIAAFGAWDVVEPMLFSLLQEAHEDLILLTQARAHLDVILTTQHLHRLVGSMAFLGVTDLEPRAIQIINQVRQFGVVVNANGLEQLQQDIEYYLQRLAAL